MGLFLGGMACGFFLAIIAGLCVMGSASSRLEEKNQDDLDDMSDEEYDEFNKSL